MDIKEYISSGIIELYASGNLTENESFEVENNIRTYPEIKAEYEIIQKIFYLTSSVNQKTPADSVKESILKKIKPVENVIQKNVFIPESESVKENYSFRYLMAASLAFLLLSLVANYYLWNTLKDTKKELTVLSDQKKIITQEYEAVNNKLNSAIFDIKIIQDKNFKAIDLKGMELSPNSNVMTYWNTDTKKVYVEVINLPAPPPDMQYQLWAISDGVPIDAGVMDVNPTDKSLHEMKNITDAQAFAVTLEPKGGSISPTMDQMYVLGNI